VTSYVPPPKNSAFIGYVMLPDMSALPNARANPTLAAGDVTVFIDGVSNGNITTLPVVTPAASRWVKYNLTAAEMNGDNIMVQFVDQTSPKEWGDVGVLLQTSTRQIDDLDTLGAGAITFTYTLTSTVDASPISDADVWATTDSAGTNVVASGTTDASGVVTFYLDAGTYYLWRQKSGYDFTNPDQETVA
jgi:hypothetical protein